jgi:hypothetical protein
MRGFCAVLIAGAMLQLASGAAGGTRSFALFDGRTLRGWEQGGRHAFNVESGMIVGRRLEGADRDKNFLCTTREYGDFQLTARFRLVGGQDANTGIQFRTVRLNAASEVSGYQADAGQGFWGNLFDEGRRNEKLVRGNQDKLKAVIRPGGWNRYDITASGRHIVLKLNGMTTVDYREDDPSIPRAGVICLQVHNGGPMRVYFNDIRLRAIGG